MRNWKSRSYTFHFHGHLVLTALLVTVANQSFLLRGLLQQVRCAALRTLFRNRLVPHDKVAVGILGTAIEDLPALGTPLRQFTSATGLGTRHTDGFWLDVLALWIVVARRK